jgi:hypothetical protein
LCLDGAGAGALALKRRISVVIARCLLVLLGLACLIEQWRRVA